MRRVHWLFVATAVLIPLVLGCSKSRTPTSPVGPSDARALAAGSAIEDPSGLPRIGTLGFFPLQVGNHWSFRYRFDTVILPTDPASTPPEYHYEADLDHEMVCRESHDGREYMVTRVTHSSPTEIIRSWIRARQDRAGLFEWDDTSGPPPCDSQAPGLAAMPGRAARGPAWPEVAARIGVSQNSAAWRAAWERLDVRRASVAGLARSLSAAGPAAIAPGEIQRLRYPLYPGQRWVIRDDPSFSARVELPRLLRTPAGLFPAWTIRYFNQFLGPEDVVRVWYGRAGYLGLQARFVSLATDETGNVIGTLVSRQSETLTEIHLVGLERVATNPLGRPTADPGN